MGDRGANLVPNEASRTGGTHSHEIFQANRNATKLLVQANSTPRSMNFEESSPPACCINNGELIFLSS